MRLLFDQNLSPRLVELLSDSYPASAHVQSSGLDRAPDETVWNYAKEHGFIIVTKDTDFHERSVIAGTATMFNNSLPTTISAISC